MTTSANIANGRAYQIFGEDFWSELWCLDTWYVYAYIYTYMYMYFWNLDVYLYFSQVPGTQMTIALVRKDHTLYEGWYAPIYKGQLHFMRWFANPKIKAID